ncbi:hypothetical protein HYR99_34080 [Candidatus Poribacteria bacterium]|nr:hypothetical protein [Candidatus Poribacteria bacterium]
MAEEIQTSADPIDHDGLFKELLHQCFELFLRLFYPQQATQLDFSDFTFLEQERLTDYPSGEHRYIDTLVAIKTLDGQAILIHLECQSSRQSGFPLRMFRYFSQLRLRGDTLIWQIVVYMPRGEAGLGFETYTETVFGETFLPFRYWCINLGSLEASVYLATKNPVAYGLAPLMIRGDISNPRLKVICLNGIASSDITPAQAALLAYFVEVYLPLTPAEQAEFEQLIQREEVTVMQFITSWERKGIEQGMKQGIEQGRAEEAVRSRQEALLELLQEKFGSLPQTAVQQVETLSSVDELRQLLRQVVHAASLAEMGLDGSN